MAEGEGIRPAPEEKEVNLRAAFSEALKQQANVVKSYDPSVCFSGAAVPVVQSCWSQIQGKLVEAVEARQLKILEDYKVMDKLSQLDDVKDSNGAPAWRPSERMDDNIQAIVEASRRLCTPEYKAELAEMEKENDSLEAQLRERQQELQELLAQEQLTVDSLNKMQSEILSS